jgi:two-component system sensor histidine kinase DegS
MSDAYTPKSMEAASAGIDDLAARIAEAREAERSRIAGELHDGPAQALANAVFQVELVERIAATDPAAVPAELAHLRQRLQRELVTIRDIISQLRPPVLDELGLDGAIQEAVELLTSVSEVSARVELTAPDAVLDDPARVVVLRVTQEALHNVRKHAAARTVLVRTELAGDDRAYILEIRDDGRGFDEAMVAARGRRTFGLQFMRERAELIDGRLDITSRPDDGTVIRLVVPTSTGVKENR